MNLLEKIKHIIKTREPNNISIEVINSEFNNTLNKDINNDTNIYTYSNLIKYWKAKDVEEKNMETLYKLYKNIKNFSNENCGIFSLFYFKDNKNFLTIGKDDNELFYLDIKCKEYQKILSNALDKNNELFVLTYWIL